eukprot:2453879-Amphidinium_carterae.1
MSSAQKAVDSFMRLMQQSQQKHVTMSRHTPFYKHKLAAGMLCRFIFDESPCLDAALWRLRLPHLMIMCG